AALLRALGRSEFSIDRDGISRPRSTWWRKTERPIVPRHRLQRLHLVHPGQPLHHLGIVRRQDPALEPFETFVAWRQVERGLAAASVEAQVGARGLDATEVVEGVEL